MIIKVTDPCQPLACPSLYDETRPLEVEVGCGRGRFLTGRAARHPECEFLGVERMKERVNVFDGKTRRLKLTNAHVVRLEALYTFHYLLPEHHARTVYVFFPDPWPKKKHHSHRLFGPLFLNALWKRLEIGGTLEFATDHEEYFHTVEECFAGDPRFARVAPMARGPEEWTEFETLFRGQGLPIFAAAWRSLPIENEQPLAPLTIAPEDEPREGIFRRECRGKEWREEHADGD
ncbi:MAG: tRNA (guanosine(46)-N7)-methyltransferase TrmB [Kiritimatiellae bacterium]|nr:tRNA (guanosine(46)-N7)-methyltransferase TrmB [Kiritimatiellia bacterium]